MFACGSSKDTGNGSGSAKPTATGSGSSTTGGSGSSASGSGSATAASGSGSAGSGSATAASGSNAGSASGSGSAAGSGSAVAAGSGSGAGSGSAAKEAPPDDGFHFDVKVTLKDKTFEQLSNDEQMKFMKEQVMPQMKAEFQAFDGKKYANFNCKTCHGKDPKASKYKMPNPDLPKLDFAKLKDGKQEPKMAAFMGAHTKPDMAKILNLTPYDEQHQNGFGCLHCHEQKK